ncbi:MAG TPA: hypothetical protein VI483_03590 [Candidatus Paceibacterota bacterium]
MRETINRLRARPKEDRRAIATGIAVSVVGVLLAGWFIYFMHNLTKGQLEYTRPTESVDDFSETEVISETQTETSTPFFVPPPQTSTTSSL